MCTFSYFELKCDIEAWRVEMKVAFIPLQMLERLGKILYELR